jgi:GNAT superfamily N-acetyltransferase
VRSAFARLLACDEHGSVLVAETSTGLLGYAVVTWGFSIESGGIDALLDELYAEPRGTGIGSGLIEAAIQAARTRGASRIFLETERGNERARALYTRHGFALEDSIWMSRWL